MADRQIKFVFEGDTKDLEAALRTVDSKFGGAEKKAKSFGITAKGAAKVAKTGVLAVAAAAAVVAGAFALAAREALNFGLKADKIAKAAAAVGATAEDFQKVIGAFELGGLTAEQTEMAIKKLGLRIGQVAAGVGGPAADAFAKIGLTWQELEALPLPERMAVLADRVSLLGSQTERAAILNSIFEESGLQMAGAFAKGGDSIRDAAQQIEDAGIITNEAALAAEDMADAVTLAGQAWTGIKSEALTPIIPLITEIGNGIAELSEELRDTGALESFGRAWVDTFLDIVAPAAITATKGIINSLAALDPAMRAVEVAGLRLKSVWLVVSGQFDKAVQAHTKLEAAEDSLAKSIRELGAVQDSTSTAAEAARKKLEEVAARLRSTDKAARDAGSGLGEGGEALGEIGDDAEKAAGKVDGMVRAIASIEVTSTLSRQASEASAALTPIVDVASNIGSAVQGLFSQIGANLSASIAEDEAQISELGERISSATSDRQRRMLTEERDALQTGVDQQKEAAMAVFVAGKAAAIAQASISTALAVVNALATPAPYPVALGFSIAAGVAGAISIATIAAEPPPTFHAGGMVAASAPDEISARLLRSEAVLSSQGVRAAGGAEGVRGLNRGGGTAAPVVTVFKVRSRVVDAMVSDNLRTKQGPLVDALRATQPRALGRHNPFQSA